MKRKIKIIILGLILSIGWARMMEVFLNNIYPVSLKGVVFPEFPYAGNVFNLFFLCIVAPFGEEAAWRWAPITIAKMAGQKYVFPTIIFFSWAFGFFLHPYLTGTLIQGVIGLIFSWVFLKAGYTSSVIVHSLYNFTYFLGYI